MQEKNVGQISFHKHFKERVLEQPIPDYIRWFHTHDELHYLSYEKTAAITAKNEIKLHAGEFLPTRVMNLFFQLSSDPPESVLENLARLCFVPVTNLLQIYLVSWTRIQHQNTNLLTTETFNRSHMTLPK